MHEFQPHVYGRRLVAAKFKFVVISVRRSVTRHPRFIKTSQAPAARLAADVRHPSRREIVGRA
jgi:hypothetical protein